MTHPKIDLTHKLEKERNVTSKLPIVSNGKLYIPYHYDKAGFFESKIVCLDTSTFNVVWEYTHPHVVMGLAASESGEIVGTFMGGNVLSFKPETGEILWDYSNGRTGFGTISNISDNRVIFTINSHPNFATVCLDVRTGEELWISENANHSYTPSIIGDKVYQSSKNTLMCRSLVTGETTWSSEEKRTYVFNVVAIDDMVAVGGHDLVNIYGTSGKLLTSITTGSKQSSIRAFVYESGRLYFGDESGVFYCYTIELGKNYLQVSTVEAKLAWKYEGKGKIESTPALYDGSIYIVTDAENLLCLNAMSGEVEAELPTAGKANISGVRIYEGDIYTAIGRFAYKISA